LRWRQISFDTRGAVVNVDEKTDRPRYVRLVMAAKPLATWRSDYYFDPTGNALVFLNARCKPFTRDAVARLLSRAARRAGVEKHVTPHIFRHSRITHLIREGVNESVIKLMMWGNINTDMFQTYAHLTGVDIDAEMLRTYGLSPEPERQHRKLVPIQCQNCHAINPPGKIFCGDCGTPLTKEAAESREFKKHAISQDEEMDEEMVRRTILKMKAEGKI